MNRVQRKRVKGYKTPENTKYVGRPTKFGNPFRLTKDLFIECRSLNTIKEWIVFKEDKKYSIDDVLVFYKKWLNWEYVNSVQPFLPPPPKPHEVKELNGKNLSCFCSLNVPCHVDVLLEQLRSNVC